MPSFTLTNLAKADLKEIGQYTQKHWGREQRNLYLGMLDASFRQLADNPLAGTDCSEIRDGYRKFRTGSHVIFYRLTPMTPSRLSVSCTGAWIVTRDLLRCDISREKTRKCPQFHPPQFHPRLV